MKCVFWGGPNDGAVMDFDDVQLVENDGQVFYEQRLDCAEQADREPDEPVLVQRGLYQLDPENSGHLLIWKGWE